VQCLLFPDAPGHTVHHMLQEIGLNGRICCAK
jgi:hypothetical protein